MAKTIRSVMLPDDKQLKDNLPSHNPSTIRLKRIGRQPGRSFQLATLTQVRYS